MSDKDFAMLLLFVWMAPEISSKHPALWILMIFLLVILGIAAHMKDYYKRKLDKLKVDSKEAGNG